MSRGAIVFIVLGGITLMGCGKEIQETSEAIKNLQSIAASAQDASKAQDKFEKLRQERKQRGDTNCLTPDALLAYLPASLDGYTAGEPSKETASVVGMSYSTVVQEYTSPSKGSVTITLTDFNGAYESYNMSSAIFAIKISVDNGEEKSGTFQTNNELVNGHESFSKSSHDATVVYGVGGRFWLEIKATQQTSSAWARSIGDKMNLAKLASM